MEGPRPVWAVKAIVVIVFSSILFRCVTGANVSVGGASGWDIGSNIQLWSSSVTFNVGDDLVFTYTPLYDVVEVDQQGYDTCTIAHAIATYDTGETVITLVEPGTRYFVCGRLGHCQQGLKLEVQVLAQSNNNGTDDDDNNNNGNDDDVGISPSARGGGRRFRPPRRRSPPSPPSPPSRTPPSPPPPRSPLPPFPPGPDIPLPPPPADGPCQCHPSHASEDSYGVMMPLITMVTILSFFYASLGLYLNP